MLSEYRKICVSVTFTDVLFIKKFFFYCFSDATSSSHALCGVMYLNPTLLSLLF